MKTVEELQEQLRRTQEACRLLSEALDAQAERLGNVEDTIEELASAEIRTRITAIRQAVVMRQQELNAMRQTRLLQKLGRLKALIKGRKENKDGKTGSL
jgi:hypothetical protein